VKLDSFDRGPRTRRVHPSSGLPDSVLRASPLSRHVAASGAAVAAEASHDRAGVLIESDHASADAQMDERARLVLAWVNDLRREHGLGDPMPHLPPGRRLDPRRCVVAQAVDPGRCIVEDDLLTLYSRTDEYGDSWITGLPWYVADFLEAFDAGAYPGLIEA
jgi:hypothetical protein